MNVYYNPEAFGLKVLRTIEDTLLSYEFSMVVVWEELNTGRLFWARDSGCSCADPFENLTDISSLTPLDRRHFQDFRTAMVDAGVSLDDRISAELFLEPLVINLDDRRRL
mgnify:CR=1 FL=1